MLTDKIFDKIMYFRYFGKNDELDGNSDFIIIKAVEYLQKSFVNFWLVNNKTGNNKKDDMH